MATLTAAPNLNAMADDVLAALSNHRQIPTFSSRAGGLTVDQAYQVIALVRAAFEARGEKIVGRKIGFTNRETWRVYSVRSPIWGYVTDHSMHQLADGSVLRVGNFVEPRIEPEIIFGLKAAPAPGMNEAALLDCIEWLSLGYEVVQSIFPGWKFAAADKKIKLDEKSLDVRAMDDNPAGQFGYHTEDDVPGRTTVGAVALRLFRCSAARNHSASRRGH
jgi:2-oxo-3-hexenedioate decarboxylase